MPERDQPPNTSGAPPGRRRAHAAAGAESAPVSWWDRVARSAPTVASSIPALLALGALGIYLVGILQAVGMLRATGVDTYRALAFSSLQDYFLRGVAILLGTTGGLLVLCLGAVGGYWVFGNRASETIAPPKPSEGWIGRLGSGATYLVLAVLVLALPVAVTVPVFGVVVAVVVAIAGARRVGLLPSDLSEVVDSLPRRLVVAFVGAIVLLATGVQAYVAPLNHEYARVRLSTNKVIAGEYVGAKDGMVYLAGKRPSHESVGNPRQRSMRAIPIARIAELRVSKEARYYRTALETIGVPFLRIEGGNRFRIRWVNP